MLLRLKMGAARSLMTRLTFMAMLGGLLAHVACSDDDPPVAPKDAGADTSTIPDTGPPNEDGSVDAGCQDPPLASIDCSFDGGADGGLPGDLRCTGLYACFGTKAVATSAQLFKPGVELWSDGAEKTRWLVLPAGTKINATDPDNWVFPKGTKVFKEFKVDGKRIETRLLEKTGLDKGSDNWSSTVYRWSADGETSAKRLDTGELVPGAGGSYQVPASSVCVRCHSGKSDMLLGVEKWSLGIATASGLTMTKMKELGLLEPPPTDTTPAIPEDGTGKAAAALGWLHANCSMCHNNGSGSAKFTTLFLDLPPTVGAGMVGVMATPTWTSAVNQPMRTGSQYTTPFPGLLRIKPADATNSLLPKADNLRNPDGGVDPLQMPPILVRKIDPKAAAVADWINALPP
jgi:hypothetical protein